MGEPEVKIRKAAARDMAFIVELWRKFGEERAGTDERYALRPEAEIIWAKWAGARMRDEASIILVAERGSDYVGYLLGHVDEAQPIFEHRRYGVITDCYVIPDLRRKGIGRRLVEQALDFFKKGDVKHVRVNALVKNALARAFWEKFGFGDFLYRMWKSL